MLVGGSVVCGGCVIGGTESPGIPVPGGAVSPPANCPGGTAVVAPKGLAEASVPGAPKPGAVPSPVAVAGALPGGCRKPCGIDGVAAMMVRSSSADGTDHSAPPV